MNRFTAEEFPEGSYSSDVQEGTQSKSKPWRIDPRLASPYDYNYDGLYEGIELEYPGEDSDNAVIPEVYDEP